MTDKLLTGMRMQVSYSDVATMPIPLYEKIKTRLQGQDTSKDKLVAALKYYADKNTWKNVTYNCHSSQVDKFNFGEVAEAALKEAQEDDRA